MKFLLVAATLAASVMPAAAQQQVICGPRASVAELLSDRFQERSVGVGVTGGGALAEMYLSDSGTWSLVVTTAGEPSCIIAGGDGWAELPPIVSGSDS